MAIETGSKMYASDMRDLHTDFPAITLMNRSFKTNAIGTGQIVTDEVEFWIRGEDANFPYSPDTWEGGTTYEIDDTVFMDGHAWRAVKKSTGAHPGINFRADEASGPENDVYGPWEDQKENVVINFKPADFIHNSHTKIKLFSVDSAGNPIDYILSYASADSPEFDYSLSVSAPPYCSYYVPPGKYKITVEVENVGILKDAVIGKIYYNPTQWRVLSGEYMRRYTTDWSDFVSKALINDISVANQGLLGSSATADGDPPGGVH